MKTVSMLEFRRHAQEIVERVRDGQRMLLTYRGKPMARLEPPEPAVSAEDPIYSLSDLADDTGSSLTNRQMDEEIYGA